jgi:hypothetical protein
VLTQQLQEPIAESAQEYKTNKKYRQQCTDWQQNFGTWEVFVCYKRSTSDEADEITAVPISSSVSAATTGHGCKNSVLSFVSSFRA